MHKGFVRQRGGGACAHWTSVQPDQGQGNTTKLCVLLIMQLFDSLARHKKNLQTHSFGDFHGVPFASPVCQIPKILNHTHNLDESVIYLTQFFVKSNATHWALHPTIQRVKLISEST